MGELMKAYNGEEGLRRSEILGGFYHVGCIICGPLGFITLPSVPAKHGLKE
jgi:hypothetical protein